MNVHGEWPVTRSLQASLVIAPWLPLDLPLTAVQAIPATEGIAPGLGEQYVLHNSHLLHMLSAPRLVYATFIRSQARPYLSDDNPYICWCAGAQQELPLLLTTTRSSVPQQRPLRHPIALFVSSSSICTTILQPDCIDAAILSPASAIRSLPFRDFSFISDSRHLAALLG